MYRAINGLATGLGLNFLDTAGLELDILGEKRETELSCVLVTCHCQYI